MEFHWASEKMGLGKPPSPVSCYALPKTSGAGFGKPEKRGGFVFFQIVGFCGDHTSNDGDGSLPCGFGTNRIGVPLVLVAQITSLWGEPEPFFFFVFFGVRLTPRM